MYDKGFAYCRFVVPWQFG